MVLGLFIAWIVFSHVIAALIPIVLEGIYWTLYFITYWFLRFGDAAWRWLAPWCRDRWASLQTWLAFKAIPRLQDSALLLLLLLIKETLWPSPDDSCEDDPFEDQGDEPEPSGPEPQQDSYGDARATLGLPETFTEGEFKRAFRRAIHAAHPDKGGSTAAAQAVYEARERIAQVHGWK